jgi:hypothetical protein
VPLREARPRFDLVLEIAPRDIVGHADVERAIAAARM